MAAQSDEAAQLAAMPRLEPLAAVLNQNKELIQSIRQAIGEPMKESPYVDDLVLYRFLKGHNFDLEKAVNACRVMLAFRAKNKLDSIMLVADGMNQKDFPHAATLEKCYPHNIFHKHDRNGQPVSIERLGHTDPGMLTRLVTLDQLFEFQFHHAEMRAAYLRRISHENNKVMRSTKIIDLSGLSTKHMDRKGNGYLRAIITTMQDNYPEGVGQIFFVNAPFIFKMIWEMVRPMLKPQTLAKVQFLSTGFEEDLLKVIAPENLPTWLGGKCECPGGCVREQDPDFGMTRVEIARRAKHEVSYPLATGSLISWQFRTENKDIGFSGEFTPEGGKPEMVVPLSRVDCFTSLISGGYTATVPGTMKLTFDNTHSMLTGKVLLFEVDVETAEELATIRANGLVSPAVSTAASPLAADLQYASFYQAPATASASAAP